MPLGRDVILRAVKKSTRETKVRVRERLLPWDKGGRKRRENRVYTVINVTEYLGS